MYQVNDDLSIYVTRGDTVFLTVSAEENGAPYVFQPDEVLRIKVFEKKACENVVLQKDFPVVEATETVDLFLTEEDTRIGEIISKPKDYWYEVELNPETNPQTIIGYDEDGAKVFKLFPEGRDLEDSEVITEEDIPFVDEELSISSKNPVQNQAIAKEFSFVKKTLNEKLSAAGGVVTGNISMSGKSVRNLADPVDDGDAVNLKFANATFAPKNHGNHVPTAESANNARFLRNDNTWHTITPEDIKVAPAEESADHPGCYYRTVDGEAEWINPPLELGNMYRTTERYNGKPVYVCSFELGQLVNNQDKFMTFNNITMIDVVDVNVSIFNGKKRYTAPMVYAMTDGSDPYKLYHYVEYGADVKPVVHIVCIGDWTSFSAICTVKYTVE